VSARAAVTVIGVGDDGCAGLTSRATSAVARAQVLVGGERHLAFFPQFKGERITLKGALSAALDRVEALSGEHHVCVLASGDPLFFGIGPLITRRIGAEHVEFIPAPSSLQWAFARTCLAWDDTAVVSVHGRSLTGFVSRVRHQQKVAVLTDPENSPPRLAARLLEYADPTWEAWVCERLGGPGERVRKFSLEALAAEQDVDPLNVLLLVRTAAFRSPPLVPYLHEDAFAKRMPKNGLITKREVRLLSLAALELREDSVIWDVGAGSGSVSIEAALIARRGRVFAVEVDPEGVSICRDNARVHGADNVTVIEGRAPDALQGLEAPDAVFVGGSKGSMEPIIQECIRALRPGGRLVVNAVTLENSAEAYGVLRAADLVPEVTLVQISRGVPLARYQRYEAQNPIHVFAVTKPPQIRVAGTPQGEQPAERDE
jgi:precorrin-6Y C5,15-methyltransferase (decarboxylating)